MRLRNSLVIAAMIATAWASAGLVTAQTLPDTSCASQVGVGASDIPHAYYTGNDHGGTAMDACPVHYSGEMGYGIGGVLLFSRESAGANGGDGVVACYGSTDPTAGPTTGHHGAHTTVNVRDDFFGGGIGFFVARDYNRTEDNPFLPASNNAGDFDCGDGIVEPCNPADGSGTDYTTFPGCNPLDGWEFAIPESICSGLSSLGPFPPAVDPTLVDLTVNFALSLLGLINGGASCAIPAGANSWTVPGGLTLGDYAGADGSVIVIVDPCVGVTNDCKQEKLLCVGVTNNCKKAWLCVGVSNNCNAEFRCDLCPRAPRTAASSGGIWTE